MKCPKCGSNDLRYVSTGMWEMRYISVSEDGEPEVGGVSNSDCQSAVCRCINCKYDADPEDFVTEV